MLGVAAACARCYGAWQAQRVLCVKRGGAVGMASVAVSRAKRGSGAACVVTDGGVVGA